MLIGMSRLQLELTNNDYKSSFDLDEKRNTVIMLC
jgi:hypothetical protein